MEPGLISRYHPSSGESIGVKKTYPCQEREYKRDPWYKNMLDLSKET
jgi:hypothetical protein